MAKKKQTKRALVGTSQTQYPSPAERERIIALRDELSMKFIGQLVSFDTAQVEQLVQEYGYENVLVVTNAIGKRMSPSFVEDEAYNYREYRRIFAQFGGARPFLDTQAYDKAMWEHTELAVPIFLKSNKFPTDSRTQELKDLLLLGSVYWEDITPPAIPPKPADFIIPLPAHYTPPTSELLSWGWDLNNSRLEIEVDNLDKWESALPALVKMTLDPGLLGGWPGEPASWAPYYALRLIGALGASDYAADLFPLLECDEDWLSDQLPDVWAAMGPEVVETLWSYIEDTTKTDQQRGVAVEGLQKVVEAYPVTRVSIIPRLTDFLDQTSRDTVKLNAYVAHALTELHAHQARNTVFKAFRVRKIDTSIISENCLDDLM